MRALIVLIAVGALGAVGCGDGNKSCGETPDGAIETRIKYEAQQSAVGESCVFEEQSRVCEDGEWSTWVGEHNYAHDTCTEDNPCATDEGAVASGTTQTRTRYADPAPDPGVACDSETQSRTCTNGVITEWSGTYTYDTCHTYAGSCSIAASAQCVDYTGSIYTAVEVLAACNDASGTYLGASYCPTANLVGKCAVYVGGNVSGEVIYYYYSGIFTEVSARTACDNLGGLWIDLG